MLCKKHGGPFKSHNTCDSHSFNKNSTQIKDHAGASRPQSNEKGLEGANFMKLMCTKMKKSLCKHTRKDRKCHTHEPDSDSISHDSTRKGGLDSTGESCICKKCKLNSSSKIYTYPSPSKDICRTKIDLTNTNSTTKDK